MSEDGIISVKSQLLDIFSELDDSELESIENWICSQSYKKVKYFIIYQLRGIKAKAHQSQHLKNKKALKNSENLLKKIGQSIKKIVPFEAEMASENIVPPVVGDQADCNKVNTCHVDEFLYDESEVDQLVKKGKLQRHYCLDCNSRNIKDLILISHSLSRQALQYIFKVLLPKDLEDKQLLDVGSRLGVVLYAAYYMTNVSKIVGIEMNKDCCDVQEKIIHQFSIDIDRIKIIHADVTTRSDIVACSDIIMINVLDFFVDVDKHKEMWYFFKKNIKKGSYLISNRSMSETLGSLEIYEEFMNWLTICKPNQLENEIFFDVEDYSELYLYIVN